MGKVLKADCSAADAYIRKDFGSPIAATWEVHFDLYIPSSTFTALASQRFSAELLTVWSGAIGGGNEDGTLLTGFHTDGTSDTFGGGGFKNWWTDQTGANPAASFAPDTWLRSVVANFDGTTITWAYAGATLFSYNVFLLSTLQHILIGGYAAKHQAGEIYYMDNVQVFDSSSTLVFHDDFESGGLSAWDNTSGAVSVVDDPAGGGGGGPVEGRVLIAFTDGPLVASPTWTRLDGADPPFPGQFVAGYDVESGRQTLLSQTDTGTATVYINDHETGLFDPRNVSSPYYGELDGRQIKLQLWDPVAAAWEDQFRGWIDDITWDIDGSAVNADGQPINASIQLQCVDMFDIFAGYGLTPGLDGITPRVVPSGSAGGPVPVGFEDGVYYATTAGTNDDRIIEILTDVGIDSTRYLVASGNTHVLAVKYDPDESALQALRDAADADMPFIANIYCNRHGDFQFRGRYSRFVPDLVAAEPGSEWDFTRWGVGDGAAIQSDPTRAQMRILSFGRNRSDLVNVAISYPQDILPADMPNQVFADTTSITAYGKHSAPPMSDLLLDKDATEPVTGFTGKVECYHYAKLVVLNQKDPRENITALQLKAIQPDDARAASTWQVITKADISHIVNVAAGYPAGTGLAGNSPEDDYYIEGRRLKVRPLNPVHDYVELVLDVSPAVWSMDTHSVFPEFPG